MIVDTGYTYRYCKLYTSMHACSYNSKVKTTMAISCRIGVEKTWCQQCGIHYCVHYIIILWWSKALASIQEVLPYSAKLSREKTFTNFAALEPPTKVFSMKFGHAIYPLWLLLAFHESFLREMTTSYQSMKVFSLKSFPLYGMYWPRFMYYNPQTWPCNQWRYNVMWSLHIHTWQRPRIQYQLL